LSQEDLEPGTIVMTDKEEENKREVDQASLFLFVFTKYLNTQIYFVKTQCVPLNNYNLTEVFILTAGSK
jgi:hypothetical protein